jgi:hypothetical protein
MGWASPCTKLVTMGMKTNGISEGVDEMPEIRYTYGPHQSQNSF